MNAQTTAAHTPSNQEIWRTVTLGLYKSGSEYAEALAAKGCKVIGVALDLLAKLECAQEPVEKDLVLVSIEDLGLADGADYGSICRRGLELGYELCPGEVGPALRLVYDDETEGGAFDAPLCVAMAGVGTLAEASGEKFLFSFDRDDDTKMLTWEHAGDFDPQDYVTIIYFLFVKPRT
jgi:hypothetical protein